MPNQYFALGGWEVRNRFCVFGDPGKMRLPNSAKTRTRKQEAKRQVDHERGRGQPAHTSFRLNRSGHDRHHRAARPKPTRGSTNA